MRVKPNICQQQLKTIGDRIRAIRAAQNPRLSQEGLAAALDVARETIGQWENGVTMPSLSYLLKICELYHVDLDYITGRLDCQTHDLQYVHDLTGLSEDAIKKLIAMNEANRVVHRVDVLSHLITHKSFNYLLSLLPADADGTIQPISVNDAYISNIDKQAVIRSELKSTIDKIADDLRVQMPPYNPDARFMQGIAFNLWKDGRLTDDQYKQTVAAYDKGDYEFIPEGFIPRRPDR